MKFSTVLALGSVALASSVSAAAVSAAADQVETFGNSPMTWIGQVTPGGPDVELSGTAEEIVAQIKVINPEWVGVSDEDATIVPRAWKGKPICDYKVSGSNANARTISSSGVTYLRRLGDGLCTARSRTCSRVSCSWNSAIELCNDRYSEARVPCRILADGAEAIVNACAFDFELLKYVKGQWFDTASWNVVVRAAEC